MTFKELSDKFNDKKKHLLFEAWAPLIIICGVLGYLFITGNYDPTGMWFGLGILGLIIVRTFWLLKKAANTKPGEKVVKILPPDATDAQKIKHWTYILRISVCVFPLLIVACIWELSDIEKNTGVENELTALLGFLYHHFGGYWPALLIPLISWLFFIFFLMRKINALKTKF